MGRSPLRHSASCLIWTAVLFCISFPSNINPVPTSGSAATHQLHATTSGRSGGWRNHSPCSFVGQRKPLRGCADPLSCTRWRDSRVCCHAAAAGDDSPSGSCGSGSLALELRGGGMGSPKQDDKGGSMNDDYDLQMGGPMGGSAMDPLGLVKPDLCRVHATPRFQFNFGKRQNLPRYLTVPTRKVKVYVLFQASNDAILHLFIGTDSGMFRNCSAPTPQRVPARKEHALVLRC